MLFQEVIDIIDVISYGALRHLEFLCQFTDTECLLQIHESQQNLP